MRAGGIRTDQVIVRKIASVQRALLCAPTLGSVEHPRKLKTLKSIRLTPFASETIRLTDQDGDTYSLRQACALTTNNVYAARAAALEGIGYAILPLWIARADLSSGHLRPACRSWTPEPLVFSMAYLPNRNRPARMVALMKHLEKEMSRFASVKLALIEHLEALQGV